MFRLPRSLGPQVAPTAEALSPQSGRAVYTTHSSVGYLPRDVASLRIRHEQLIRLDFHQLDCSLVGCSDALYISIFTVLGLRIDEIVALLLYYYLSSLYRLTHPGQ